LLADTAQLKCAVTIGKHGNSEQMHLINFFPIPLERKNKQRSLESKIKKVKADEGIKE
jgi:hypothetical protein